MRLSPNISCGKLALLISTICNQIKLLQKVGIFPTSVFCENCESNIPENRIKSERIVFICNTCKKQYPMREDIHGIILSNCMETVSKSP